MQSISRFLAVLIALIFLIGPLAGTAAAHETEDGDHEGADYGSLSLTRLDDLGDSVHVGQMLQFGVTFTESVTNIQYLVATLKTLNNPHGCGQRSYHPEPISYRIAKVSGRTYIDYMVDRGY